MLTSEDRHEIEQLLYREAHLLDERRFREWLDLLTEDIEYLMPLTEHVQGKVAPPATRSSRTTRTRSGPG